MPSKADPETVVVIGSGISGLAAAWLLTQQGKRVTLLEAEDRLGGHALTVDTDVAGPIDLGFQVCNLTNYPHLFGFFDALGIETVESDMSFALSTPEVEWGSRSLEAVFATSGSARSPRFLAMLRDIVAFGRQAPEVLADPGAWEGVTLGQYLRKRRYSSRFADHYVVPMCAAIWSCSDSQALDFPVVPLVRFWSNHHLLDLLQRPVWRVVKGRSRTYVAAAAAALPDVRTGAPVASIRPRSDAQGGGVSVKLEGGGQELIFDAAVLATHSDVSLRLLGECATSDEANILGAIRYGSNQVYVHTDASLMPRSRSAWASWNCIKRGGAAEAKAGVCVSYWVNLLQNLPAGTPDVFVTLNPPTPPDAAKTIRHLQLAHPIFDEAALRAQQRVPELQGIRSVYFCGAWCGYGFHEDGIASAVRAAEAICGGKPVTPWEPFSCSVRMSLVDRTCLDLFLRFGEAMLARGGALRLVLPNGTDRVLGDAAAPAAATSLVRVRRASLFRKVVTKSDIGLGEAYMDGDFECDIFRLLLLLSRSNAGSPSALKQATANALGWAGGALHALYERLEYDAHTANSNSEEGSARNISYHYDAGNDFYKLVLDPTMLYSAAVFSPERAAALQTLSYAEREASLVAAQHEKIDAMIAAAQLRPGEHVLEIGCGWGTCACRMAATAGVRVTGITISKEQLAEGRKRVHDAGLDHLVTLMFCDYRQVEGTFDKVVSIEMIEAVGHEHLPTFFAAVSRALKPGGLAAIQVITLPDERYDAYCNSHSDFIRTHIFPGGHLPSMGAMTAISSRLGLELYGAVDVGDDYAITLRLWRERLMANAGRIQALGYPRRFIRMYEFYFAYCEAGFANQLIHDYQLTFRKSPLPRPLAVVAPAVAAVPPFDPLTFALLVLWSGLCAVLIASRPHMAAVPAALGLSLALPSLLAAAARLPRAKASALASALAAAAIVTSAASLLLAASFSPTAAAAAAAAAVPKRATHRAAKAAAKMAAAAGPASPPLRMLAAALLQPSPPAALLPAARGVVGASAGVSAARAWESVRHRSRGTALGAAASSVFLMCAATALYYDVWLLPLALSQLSEAHTCLVHVNTLWRDGARSTGGLGWIAFALLRVAPHATLLGLVAPAAAEPSAAMGGALAFVALQLAHDATLALSMARRALLASRVAHLEALVDGNHRTLPK